MRVYCINIIARYPNCKETYQATSTKYKIARGVWGKDKKIENSRAQRNLDSFKERDNREIKPDEIVLFHNTSLEENSLVAKLESSFGPQSTVGIQLNNSLVIRGENVRRYIAYQVRANLISKRFSKRNESEVVEMKQIKELRYKRKIKEEYTYLNILLNKISRDERKRRRKEEKV